MARWNGPFLLHLEGNKDNIVRFIANSGPLLIYELNILRVSSPRSKVQQRSKTKKITKIGCGSVYNFKKLNRWPPLLVKRALVFGWKIHLLSRKWLIDDRSMIGRDFSINSMVWEGKKAKKQIHPTKKSEKIRKNRQKIRKKIWMKNCGKKRRTRICAKRFLEIT